MIDSCAGSRNIWRMGSSRWRLTSGMMPGSRPRSCLRWSSALSDDRPTIGRCIKQRLVTYTKSRRTTLSWSSWWRRYMAQRTLMVMVLVLRAPHLRKLRLRRQKGNHPRPVKTPLSLQLPLVLICLLRRRALRPKGSRKRSEALHLVKKDREYSPSPPVRMV